ncbi:MAG: 2-hydroxyacid dehydrogenase [Anaerolineae bacterium]
MKVAVFSTKPYDRTYLTNSNTTHELTFFEPRLTIHTAPLADGHDAVCPFVNDELDSEVLTRLAYGGVELIALRSAGYNHVDIRAATDLGLTVARVPAYSPHAVAEHTVALILGLNRKLYRAYNRVRDGNFARNGLLGFDLHGKVVGIIGTGKIGSVTAEVLRGFGCELIGYDPYPNDYFAEFGTYVDLPELFRRSAVISLHAPLNPDTYHTIDEEAISQMKDGVMLINTSRGALIDTVAVIEGLKSGKIGSVGFDLYEEEGDLFFEDLSGEVITDDVFARLLTFPNVLITGHQAFFTEEALQNIADTTMENITEYEDTGTVTNIVSLEFARS